MNNVRNKIEIQVIFIYKNFYFFKYYHYLGDMT